MTPSSPQLRERDVYESALARRQANDRARARAWAPLRAALIAAGARPRVAFPSTFDFGPGALAPCASVSIDADGVHLDAGPRRASVRHASVRHGLRFAEIAEAIREFALA